jgi:RNA polymerase sigma factor FliA
MRSTRQPKNVEAARPHRQVEPRSRYQAAPELVAVGMRGVRYAAHGESGRLGNRGGGDELVSHGYEGLASACASFDPTRGVPFQCWAAIRVRGAILDGLRAELRWRKMHRADGELAETLADRATAAALPSILRERSLMADVTPEEALEHAELAARARAAIESLPAQERRLVQRHYFDGMALADAGAELGLSRSWASRLHARALSRVRRAMAAAGHRHAHPT